MKKTNLMRIAISALCIVFVVATVGPGMTPPTAFANDQIQSSEDSQNAENEQTENNGSATNPTDETVTPPTENDNSKSQDEQSSQNEVVEQAPAIDDQQNEQSTKSSKKKVKAAAVTKDRLDGDYQYLSRASISSMTTGTAPFDDDDAAGNDSSADNNIVRTYDSLNYTISVVSKGYDTSTSYKSGYTWYRFVVPGSDSAQTSISENPDMDDAAKLALLQNEMEIDISSMGWMTKETGTDYDYKLELEEVDGKWCQVLYASNYLKSSSSAFPIALSNVNLALSVKNMRNGDKIQPTMYTWIDHNDVDKENWDPNYVCSSHAKAPNGGKELKKLVADEVTVSAAPKYNVQIKATGTGWVGAEADFNFTTGNEKALNKNASNNAFGQIREYGITVQLYNDSPSKGLKGIEMPKGDITFDMDIAAVYEGANGKKTMTTDAFFVPKVWSYDKHNTSANKQDERSISDYTNIYYARDAAPLGSKSETRGKIRGTTDSGSWTATQNGSKVSFTVTDYKVDTSYMPVLDYGDYNAVDDYTKNVGGFSAGQFYLVIPYGKNDNELLNTYGNGHINLDLQLNNFKATSVTDQTTTEIRNPELDHLNQSIEFVGPGDFIDELMWSYPHRNGESGWSDVDKSTTHYEDGGDSAQTGQQVDILFGYGLTNNSAKQSFYGIDTLMTFDPTAFEFDTDALAAGEISSLIETANKGDSSKQTVKYYFAVASKALTDDEMKSINVDGRDNNGNLVAALKYYENYEDAKSAGTIVGALQSVRYPSGEKASLSRLYTLGALHLKVRNDEAAMKSLSEGGILNGVYGTTIVSRVYAGDGSKVVPAAVANNGSYNKTTLDNWFEQANFDKPNTATNKGAYARRGTWNKATWADNGSIINAGSGGHWWGDSLHIVPYKAGVKKNILQTVGAAHSKEKQTYNLDNNQSTVDFKITPSVGDGTGVEGTTPIEITLTDTLDEGLIVDPEKVYYGGDYTENEDQGFTGMFSGGITVGETSEDGITFESCELTDELDEETGQPTGRTIMTIVLSGAKVNQELQPIYYSADIKLATSYKNRQYENTVVIDTPGDKRVKAEPQGNLATAGFTVEKNLSLSLSKRSEKPVYEVGEDVTYLMSWANTGANMERNCIMMDSMPKDGYGNSSFKGTYNKITEMTITPAESLSLSNYSFYYTDDDAAYEMISGDYTVNKIRSEWKQATIDPNTGEVSLPSGFEPSAWCIIGNIPSKEQVEAKFTIDCKDAQGDDLIENTSSLKEGSTTTTTRMADRKLSGLTWLDKNKNGKRESSEKVLPGVTVKLYLADDYSAKKIYTNKRGNKCITTTDKKGKYEFDALDPGKYIVEFTDGDQVKLAYYKLTKRQVDGVNKKVNSDARAVKEGNLLQTAYIKNDLNTDDIDMPELWDYQELGYIYEIPYLDAGFYRTYPKVEIEKTVNKDKAKIGDTLTYKIKVTNTSKIDAIDYVLKDTLGKGLEYVSDNAGGKTKGITTTWTKTIKAGKSITITVKAKVTDNAIGKVTNAATVAPPDDPARILGAQVNTDIVGGPGSVTAIRTSDPTMLTLVLLLLVAAGVTISQVLRRKKMI